MQTMEVTSAEDFASKLIKDATKRHPLSAADEKRISALVRELIRPGEVFEYAAQNWGLGGGLFLLCSNKRVAILGGMGKPVSIPFRDLDSVGLEGGRIRLQSGSGKPVDFYVTDQVRAMNIYEIITDHLAEKMSAE